MALRLYTDKTSPTLSWKILASANYSGVSLDVVSDFNVDSPDFLAKSPVGKVPVLVTSEGSIFEANAIARYVAKQGDAPASFLGATPLEAALIDQWVEFAVNEIDLPASVWTFPILGFISNNASATGKAKGDIRKVFEALSKHLATRTYLAGHRVTLADVSVAASLYHLYQLVVDAGFRKAFPNVTRWYLTVVNQPHVKPVFGDVQLCEKAQIAPETAAPEHKEEKPKHEEKPKKTEKAKEEKPKEEKPKAKKPADDEEEEESFEDDAPKGKNPLDSLPPSSLVMDEWKRTYSNNDTRAVAMPWFFEHYDPAGYSLWFCRYKFTEELEVTFKTANLVGGFLQRLDKLRKYGFGSMLIFGEDGKLDIEGAWLVRGTEVPAELATCDDYELYHWVPVDLSNEQQKQLLIDYWAWDGEFAGREALWGKVTGQAFNQGKTFK